MGWRILAAARFVALKRCVGESPVIKGDFEWYSHQELNLDQRFRKPLLYPFELWEQSRGEL